MANKTILYYTSNREKPEFEQKIRDNILNKCGGLPIISVSQKPIDFGYNICVGDVGLSYLNEWRQIIIGAKKAKTKYLIFAESDFLYPPEYFEFEPKGENIYRCNNIWIIFKQPAKLYRIIHSEKGQRIKKEFFIEPAKAYRKKYSEGAQIVKREFIIKHLSKCLEGCPKWHDGKKIEDYMSRKKLWRISRFLPFIEIRNKIPCISFKTGQGVRPTMKVSQEKKHFTYKLPYWGKVSDIKEKYEV